MLQRHFNIGPQRGLVYPDWAVRSSGELPDSTILWKAWWERELHGEHRVQSERARHLRPFCIRLKNDCLALRQHRGYLELRRDSTTNSNWEANTQEPTEILGKASQTCWKIVGQRVNIEFDAIGVYWAGRKQQLADYRARCSVEQSQEESVYQGHLLVSVQSMRQTVDDAPFAKVSRMQIW